MTKRPVTAVEAATWIHQYESGLSLREIAKRAGRGHKAVRYHLIRNGIHVRTHGEYTPTIPVNKPRVRRVDWCNECCEVKPLNHRTGWCQPCTDAANARRKAVKA